MGRCGPWRRAGVELWDVVDRSWCVFVRNTNELLRFLAKPSHDPAILQLILTGGPIGSSGFWEELDQRLHNHLSSATSLVDHTRRLTRFYGDDASEFVSRFQSRNELVREMKQAAFLRDLRNYLLHYGIAPVVVSLSLGGDNQSTGGSHAIKLDAKRLLQVVGYQWKQSAREYLKQFDEHDGPIIIDDVTTYAKAMQDAYSWLFEQRSGVLSLTPERFLIPMP